MLRCGSQSALARCSDGELVLLGHDHARRRGGCGPARRSSASPWSCCSTPTSASSPSTAGPARARRCWPSPPGSSRSSSAATYERLAVYRPLVPVGRADVGFLPGGLDEKLDPWMSAIHDAIVALTDQRSSNDAHRLVDELINRSQLSLESVTFLRGRSLHRQIVVVDEAQNLEPTTLKTVLTRIGDGTKVVFTGDTSQIDAPVPRRVEQRPGRADPGVRRPALLRPRHAHRLRARRGGQPGRRTALDRQTGRSPITVARIIRRTAGK